MTNQTGQLEDVYAKSVTRDDLGKVKNGVMQIVVPFYYGDDRRPLPPMLPPFWSYQRDIILRTTVNQEAMWAAAVSIAITKVSSLSWELTGETASAKRIKEVQQLLLQADGRQVGWTNFISKHLRDFLCSDNGSFIEIVRASKSIGSRIVGLRHLDSIRCLNRHSLITTESGVLPIEEIVNTEYKGKVLSLNMDTGLLELKGVTGWHKNTMEPNKFWVEFNTENGNRLKCTNDHEIFTDLGWVKAETLGVGKRVVINDENTYKFDTITSFQTWEGGDIDTYCIDVEGNHNFFSDNILVHNCTRTGDPKFPVIYRDKWGRLHTLADYQVMMFSDMPDPSETYFGVGLCSASRAYKAIYKLAAIENYLAEKVTGLKPLAIYIVNGVIGTQLQDAVKAAKDDQIARGLAAYMGAVILGVPEDAAPQLVTIPLAELPDRFNRKEEFDISLLTYADNLGLDPQDLQPLSGQALGTGAQSQILHDKAQGKGIVSWRQAFTHAINEYVTPQRMTFAFTELDYRDLQQKVDISTARVGVAAARIGAGITQPSQELQLLVDEDELPEEFLQVPDITPGGTVSDEDKVPTNEEESEMIVNSDDGTNVNTEEQEGNEQSENTEEQTENSEQTPIVWGLEKKKPDEKKEEENKAMVWGRKEFEKGNISKEAIEAAYAIYERTIKK